MTARKAQLTVYLAPATLRLLETFARNRGAAKSLIAETAVLSYLSGDDADRREATIAKRLDRIARILERNGRNGTVQLEAFALFVRFWMTATPELPEHGIAAARRKGAQRYDDYIEALGRRLVSSKSVMNEIALDSRVPGFDVEQED